MALKWVPVDAFHLPEIPAELKVDPVLAALLHLACFAELSGERSVDFDESMSAMEAVGYYLQRLPQKRRKDVDAQLKRVADYGKKRRWKKEAVVFVRGLLADSGLED